ncbi:MAG: YceD family protein [Halofilum sp. (in: g-proteobacteria)]|nr:YceD family protein [Halofilum sp. (in: g-proteobacteria)]
MSDRLPVHLDPVALADRGRALAGHVPIESFERLADALHSREGTLEAELAFGHDDAGRRVLHGRLRGALELVCQRCLAPYPLAVDVDVALVLVENEAEADTLPDELDALVVGTRRSMHTVDMLEDDLILELPIVPRCNDAAACRPAVELLDSEAIEAGEEAPRQRPFAGLDEEH